MGAQSRGSMATPILQVCEDELAHLCGDWLAFEGEQVKIVDAEGSAYGAHGVANGIVAWTKERQSDYLYWRAHGTGRQQLYDKMIRCFADRGSGWRRLQTDPFTRPNCQPDVFWLTLTSDHHMPHPGELFHASLTLFHDRPTDCPPFLLGSGASTRKYAA